MLSTIAHCLRLNLGNLSARYETLLPIARLKKQSHPAASNLTVAALLVVRIRRVAIWGVVAKHGCPKPASLLVQHTTARDDSVFLGFQALLRSILAACVRPLCSQAT
eukprot:6748425-Alexandrium_andersonii.AAC.1